MNSYVTAPLGIVLAVALKLHLAIQAVGVTVIVSIPWAFVACGAGALVVVVYLIVRELTGFCITRGRV